MMYSLARISVAGLSNIPGNVFHWQYQYPCQYPGQNRLSGLQMQGSAFNGCTSTSLGYIIIMG